MNKSKIIWMSSLSALMIILGASCKKNEIVPIDFYACSLNFSDTSAVHPKAVDYQDILENHRKEGLVGAVLLIKDEEGLWIGADGKADIASDVNLEKCNSFFIGSVSKVFTSAAIYRYHDRGIINLEDPISKWIDESIIENISNAEQAQVHHLLSHQSGIADYYTLQFESDRINNISNNFTKEKVLEYIYGKSATNEVGEKYHYSNTNFLLLSMVLEGASGLGLEQIYHDELFTPLDLNSGYYSEDLSIPNWAVKGYFDIYRNDSYVESEFLYGDELGIGGDGGILMNAFDVSIFLENLMKGEVIASSSLTMMTSWFDIPSESQTSRQLQNGFGIERFETEHGFAVGHTGSLDGFISFAFYFPEADKTFVLLSNSAGSTKGSSAIRSIFQESLEKMFE